jgi:hypothetical protein
MLLSIYTYVKNAVYWDYPVVSMLKHHLPLADEIIVNEGRSTDGTYERISGIDPKIKIFQTDWEEPNDTYAWYLPLKDAPRRQCKGKWCLHLDTDEFIPEWEFEDIRRHISSATEDFIPVHFINFYANYKVYHPRPASVKWPSVKLVLHRNLPDIEFWGDGSNLRKVGQEPDWNSSPLRVHCHHFGAVRDAARLREKSRIQGGMYRGRRPMYLPKFLYRLFPYDWKDRDYLDDLQIYDGPYVKAVRDNPDEFVRDKFRLYDYLKSRQQQLAPA